MEPTMTERTTPPAILILVAVAALTLMACGQTDATAPPAQRAQPTPATGPLTAEQLRLTPPTWHGYLQAMRKADMIADPLERCLAFPDLPGTQWPEGHAAAHCVAHFAPGITKEEIEVLVGKSDFEGLGQRMRVLDEMHAKTKSSEGIHAAFGLLLESADIERIVSKWRKQAPGDLYAEMLRAEWLASQAGAARGQDTASKTPPAAFARMRQLLDDARVSYARVLAGASPDSALRLQALILAQNVAMLDGDRNAGDDAFRKAQAMAPDCESLASVRMNMLQPRWGGSYQEMEAYAKTLEPMVRDTPQLQHLVVEPLVHRAEMLRCRASGCTGLPADNGQIISLLRRAIDQASDEEAMHALAHMHRNGKVNGDYHESLIMEAQAERFRAESDSALFVASMLPEDSAWRAQYVERGLASATDKVSARRTAGELYFQLGQPEEAERHLVACLELPKSDACLAGLAWGWLSTQSLAPAERSARAKPWLDRALSATPNDPSLLLFRVMQAAYAGDDNGEQDALARFDALPQANSAGNIQRRATIVKVIDQSLGRPPQ